MNPSNPREEALDRGLLVDVSDIGWATGYRWPVALSRPLADAIDASLGMILALMPDPEEVQSLARINLMVEALDALEQIMGDVSKHDLDQVNFCFQPSWRDDGAMGIRLMFERGDAGEPVFTLRLAEEKV